MSKLNAATMEGFVNTVLRKNFDRPVATPEFHREIWALVTSANKQVAIAAPRYHAKSTIVTHAYTLASVLFRESRYVLIVSDTVTQAIQFLGDIKKELVGNDDLRGLFSVKELSKDTEDDLIVEMTDGHTFRIQAKGSEQKLRGLKWANLRPDLIIGDDLENDEIVMNKDRRMKFKRWFYGALIPCIASTGKIRIVGTILHLDSLLENLMPSSQIMQLRGNGKSPLIQEDLKEYTNNKLPWKSVKYRAHTDDFKLLLWPEMKTAEEFQLQKLDYVRQGLADVYSQEMLNIPMDISDTFFKLSDFIAMKPDDQKKRMTFYITCDLAVSTNTRADYSAFVVGGMDEDGRLYCKHVVRERMDALQIVDTIFMLNKIYKPILFGFEVGVITKAIGPYLNEAMLKRGEFISMAMLKPSGDKITRARSIQARMRSGACRFDKSADWYQTFEDELLRFPRDRNDDQVDAFAYLGLMLDKMSEASTDQEVEAQEYEEFKRESGYQAMGRSAVCGY
jgi:predicted phage terminase large subunit-like protein